MNVTDLALLDATTANLIALELFSLPVAKWILKSDNTQTHALAIPRQAGTPTTYTSLDGVTWVTTSVTGAWGSSDIPVDVAWSPYLGLWMVAVQVGGVASTVKFYKSSDAVSWTIMGSGLTTQAVSAITACGTVWIAATYNSSSFYSHIIVSADGASWYGTQTYLRPTSSSPPVLASSPTQVGLIAQPTSTGVLNPYRFTPEFGIPDAVLT